MQELPLKIALVLLSMSFGVAGLLELFSYIDFPNRPITNFWRSANLKSKIRFMAAVGSPVILIPICIAGFCSSFWLVFTFVPGIVIWLIVYQLAISAGHISGLREIIQDRTISRKEHKDRKMFRKKLKRQEKEEREELSWRKPLCERLIREAFAKQHQFKDKYRQNYVSKNLSQILSTKDQIRTDYIHPQGDRLHIKDMPHCRYIAGYAIKYIGKEQTHHLDDEDLAQLLLNLFEEPHKQLELAEEMALQPQREAKIEEKEGYELYKYQENIDWKADLEEIISKTERMKELTDTCEGEKQKIDESSLPKDIKKMMLKYLEKIYKQQLKKIISTREED